MAESDWCCGCGGSFNLQNYEISAAIGKRKCDNILQSGAGVVATGCPACMLQITDLLSQAGGKVQVKHVVELYAEALGERSRPGHACQAGSGQSLIQANLYGDHSALRPARHYINYNCYLNSDCKV